MWTKKLLVQACVIALAAPFAVSAQESCVGRFYPQGQEVEVNVLPSVRIVTTQTPILRAGETLNLSLDYTIDPSGTPNAFWCTQNGKLSAADATALTATFTAPDYIEADNTLRLGVQLADGKGHVAGESMYVLLKQSNSGYAVSGILLDADGKPLAGVTVTIDGKTAVTDANGRYTLSGLAAGTYDLTASKDGYSFAPTQITLSADNPNPDIRLVGTESGQLAVAQLAVATQACSGNANSQVVLFDKSAQPVHSFDSGMAGKGIRLFTTNWDNDSEKTTDFLLASTLRKGNGVTVFSFLGQSLGTLAVSTLDQGVNLAFARLSDAMLALSAAQDKEDTVSLWRIGQPVELLKLLGNPSAFNISAGDLDGDGEDELVLVLASKTDKPNVGIFDNQGNLLRYFSALAGDGNKTPGLVVTVLDTNGDGKAEIVVANAEGQDFEVGIYQADGTLVKRFKAFDASTPDARRTSKLTVCHNGHSVNISENAWPAHQSHGDTLGDCPAPITGENQSDENSPSTTTSCPLADGLLLTGGDFNQDGTTDIIVGQKGGQKIRVFSGTGQLLSSFPGTQANNEALSSVVYGSNMKLSVPVITEAPPVGESLDDVDLIGDVQNPPDLGDREVTGQVRLSHVVIGKLNIHLGARLIVGAGVRFKHVHDIPHGLDVSGGFRQIEAHAGHGHKVVPAIDLSRNVADDAPPLIQSIQVVLNGLPIQQVSSHGNLVIVQNTITYILRPVRVRHADKDKRPGVHVRARGVVSIVTEAGQEVETVPAMQNLADFIQGLSGIQLDGLEMDEQGQMTAKPTHNDSGMYYVGMADLSAEEANDADPLGLISEDSTFFPTGNQMLVTLVFKDEHGHKHRQRVYSRAAYPDLLLSQTALGFEVYPNGTLSFTWNDEFYQGLLGYGVLSGSFVSASGRLEFYPTADMNADGIDDFEIVYPNGDRQPLYIFR